MVRCVLVEISGLSIKASLCILSLPILHIAYTVNQHLSNMSQSCKPNPVLFSNSYNPYAIPSNPNYYLYMHPPNRQKTIHDFHRYLMLAPLESSASSSLDGLGGLGGLGGLVHQLSPGLPYCAVHLIYPASVDRKRRLPVETHQFRPVRPRPSTRPSTPFPFPPPPFPPP